MYSALEITDKEFLIKLDRSKFSINLIRTLLKIVEVSNLSDVDEVGNRTYYGAELNKPYASEPDYFSNLEEK